MSIISTKIKELRIEKGLTQKQLANAISTTDDSIYSCEKGRSEPNCDMSCALCNYFEVSADFLLGRTEY